jgi:hypothetical protein
LEGQHRKFVRYVEAPTTVVKRCDNCEYNYDGNDARRKCHPIIGLCTSYNKWRLYNPFTIEGKPTSRYDTQMVEHAEMIEQIVEFPMVKEEM